MGGFHSQPPKNHLPVIGSGGQNVRSTTDKCRRCSPAKGVCAKSASRVRIPPSPPVGCCPSGFAPDFRSQPPSSNLRVFNPTETGRGSVSVVAHERFHPSTVALEIRTEFCSILHILCRMISVISECVHSSPTLMFALSDLRATNAQVI